MKFTCLLGSIALALNADAAKDKTLRGEIKDQYHFREEEDRNTQLEAHLSGRILHDDDDDDDDDDDYKRSHTIFIINRQKNKGNTVVYVHHKNENRGNLDEEDDSIGSQLIPRLPTSGPTITPTLPPTFPPTTPSNIPPIMSPITSSHTPTSAPTVQTTILNPTAPTTSMPAFTVYPVRPVHVVNPFYQLPASSQQEQKASLVTTSPTRSPTTPSPTTPAPVSSISTSGSSMRSSSHDNEFACPQVPLDGCSVCGEGRCVTKPDAIFAVSDQPPVPCGELEVAGLKGVIPLRLCEIVKDFIPMCGCATAPP